mmetsp:Transcript_21818/g.36426  ORF Transcript_21818/g.36426 Transcript_21818/m.36426 type:complete len:85 (+) Transcript_21818:29-283(+)
MEVEQKPPPETEGQGAKEGPKEPAEGAAEGAAARTEVSAGGDDGPAGEQAPVRVKEEPPDSPERHAEPETAAEGKMTDGEIQEV